MEGQVFVPYTKIGGLNMDTGIMLMGLEGSTNGSTNPDGESPLHFYVQWTMPGGIVGQGIANPGAAWGYIIGRKEQEYIPYTDAMFIAYLEKTLSAYEVDFDENGTLIKGDEGVVKNTINNLVYAYFRRVIDLTGLEDGYDWGTMNRQYHECMN